MTAPLTASKFRFVCYHSRRQTDALVMRLIVPAAVDVLMHVCIGR